MEAPYRTASAHEGSIVVQPEEKPDPEVKVQDQGTFVVDVRSQGFAVNISAVVKDGEIVKETICMRTDNSKRIDTRRDWALFKVLADRAWAEWDAAVGRRK